MRMRKLRGPHMKKSMPFEPFRTHTQPVNLGDLEERFDAGAEVTPETLREGRASPSAAASRSRSSAKRRDLQEADRPAPTPSAPRPREKIEAAGGTCDVIE